LSNKITIAITIAIAIANINRYFRPLKTMILIVKRENRSGDVNLD